MFQSPALLVGVTFGYSLLTFQTFFSSCVSLSLHVAISLVWVEMWTLILDHTFITRESAKP